MSAYNVMPIDFVCILEYAIDHGDSHRGGGTVTNKILVPEPVSLDFAEPNSLALAPVAEVAPRDRPRSQHPPHTQAHNEETLKHARSHGAGRARIRLRELYGRWLGYEGTPPVDWPRPHHATTAPLVRLSAPWRSQLARSMMRLIVV